MKKEEEISSSSYEIEPRNNAKRRSRGPSHNYGLNRHIIPLLPLSGRLSHCIVRRGLKPVFVILAIFPPPRARPPYSEPPTRRSWLICRVRGKSYGASTHRIRPNSDGTAVRTTLTIRANSWLARAVLHPVVLTTAPYTSPFIPPLLSLFL